MRPERRKQGQGGKAFEANGHLTPVSIYFVFFFRNTKSVCRKRLCKWAALAMDIRGGQFGYGRIRRNGSRRVRGAEKGSLG